MAAKIKYASFVNVTVPKRRKKRGVKTIKDFEKACSFLGKIFILINLISKYSI